MDPAVRAGVIPIGDALPALVALVETSVPVCEDGPVVIAIDGRSGSGKSTLARRLAALAPGSTVVAMDSIYPGWDGLAAGIDRLVSGVLLALAQCRAAGHPRWSWIRERDIGWVTVPTASVVIVDGVGSSAARARPLLSASVWIEMDADERHRRAMARDGELYRPHWQRWAAQEDAYLRSDRPAEHAQLVLSG